MMKCDNCKKKIWFWQRCYEVGLIVVHHKCFGESWFNKRDIRDFTKSDD